ncbi:ATP-binding protein [Paenibacillus lutrae]|uniref:histidine kinase n=1 Tax=Paenibacillus lutrae TaxID=2078573 RepID=A0A7X3K1S2_9BACL|nr:ATP-binding protein [Paenibacillus lutrae]MVP02543.1 response regulator [Paenibacillus lutrae]
MKTTRSRLSMSYVFAIVLLLALVGTSSYISSLNMEKQSDAVIEDAMPVISAANNLLQDLLNQETGIRGYLITADESFLEPYEKGKTQLKQDLETIHKLEAGHADLRAVIQTEVTPQIDKMVSFYSSQIELVQTGKIEEARKRISKGKEYMDEYRTIHVKVADVLQTVSDNSHESIKKAGSVSRFIILSGGLLGIILGVFSGFILLRASRAERQLRKSEETYRFMAESLEAQNEEIIAQQEEQQITLSKLSDRERELELISNYQEKLTGFTELKQFLRHSIPALLDSLSYDAALVVVEDKEAEQFEVLFSSGYPQNFTYRVRQELYGPARRLFDEGRSFVQKREASENERGLHDGISVAIDHYFPLQDEQQRIIGYLLLTNYHELDRHEDKERLTQGLIRQFDLAFYAQMTNDDRRKQSLNLSELNEQLIQEKQNIESQRDLIKGILESAHEGMMMCDRNGKILIANRQMEKYFHLNHQIGQDFVESCKEIAATSNGFINVSQSIKALFEGDIDRLIERFTFMNGEEPLFTEIYATSVGENGNADSGFLFVFRDRTEEERIDAMKNEFVSIVSHELRTPLASVLGFIEILIHRELSREKQQKYLDTIFKEATRLSNLINDFLDLQRMESGRQIYHFAPVDIKELVNDVVDKWQDKQNHEIKVYSESAENWVRGDSDRLRQVIQNLLSNAIKYSPGAQEVDIRIRQVDGSVLIDIRDYGLGIPNEAKEYLFSKFYRVDNSDRRQIGGTGLGLAIVKEIVEGHNGMLTFQSEMGRGSTFTIALEPFEMVSLNGRIVIFEDDDNLAKLIQVALTKLQLPSVQLRSAEEGILSLHRKTTEAPLLFIVDIHLEGAQTGWDFLAELYHHPIYNRTPVIVSTALEPPMDYHEKDIEKFMRKPFTMERLIQVAQDLISNRHKPSYVFPTQDRNLITTSLERNGIKVNEIKESSDMIEFEINTDDNDPNADKS